MGLLSVSLTAQSSRQYAWSATDLQLVTLNVPFCGQLQLQSHAKNTIELSYQSEGEYQDQMGIRANLNGLTLGLNEYQNPLFQKRQDKLAAHKIVASRLRVLLPTHLEIDLQMKSGQLTVDGQFEQIQIQMEEGNCLLTLSQTDGRLLTRSATTLIYPKQMKVTTVSQTLSCSTSKTEHHFEIITRSGSISCISE